MNLNNIWVGLITGLFLPALTFIIFFAYMSDTKDITTFLSQLGAVGIKTSFFSLAALPSFFAFFAFYTKKYNRSAQGVVLATLLLTLLIVVVDL